MGKLSNEEVDEKLLKEMEKCAIKLLITMQKHFSNVPNSKPGDGAGALVYALGRFTGKFGYRHMSSDDYLKTYFEGDAKALYENGFKFERKDES